MRAHPPRNAREERAMPANPFVWYELRTSDPAAAEAFYTAVVGWRAQAASGGGKPYTVLSIDEGPVAGLMAIPDEVPAAGRRPRWLGYIAAAVARLHRGRRRRQRDPPAR